MKLFGFIILVVAFCVHRASAGQNDLIANIFSNAENEESDGKLFEENTKVEFIPVFPNGAGQSNSDLRFLSPSTVFKACQVSVEGLIRDICVIKSETALKDTVNKCCSEPCSFKEIRHACIIRSRLYN